MTIGAPPVDARDAEALAAELRARLAASVPEWSPADRETGAPDQASTALIEVAARFGEIVIERLNQAPNKNFLAFLDLLGTAPLPPEPARVPLTFSVATGSATDAVVRAGTQVAATLAPGETTPVTFETERELTAIAATLTALVGVDVERDLIADHSALIGIAVPEGVSVFDGNRANEHVVYLGHRTLFASANIKTLTLDIQLASDSPAAADARVVQWEIWDGVHGIPLAPVDGTQALRTSGSVVFDNPGTIPEMTIDGIAGRWLRCRLLTPVSRSASPAQDMVRASQLPIVAAVRASVQLHRAAVVPDAALTNAQTIDVTRAFLPFGDRPRIGDAFYLASRDALGQPGGTITIDVALANPVPDSVPPQQRTVPSQDLQLRWETWDGTRWAVLGVTSPTGPIAGSASTFTDDAKAFTKSSKLTFTLPPTLASRKVNGIDSNWVRVQIVAGNYGVDATYVADGQQPGGFRLLPATFNPPIVTTLTLSVDAASSPAAPDNLIAFNNAQFADLTASLASGRAVPFIPLPDQLPSLYLAFTLPPTRATFPNRTLSLYHGVRQPPYGERSVPLSPTLSIEPADAGTTIVHRFTLTNPSTEPVHYDLAALGGAWASIIEPAHVTLLGGLSTEVKVSVVVPAAVDGSDRASMILRSSADDAVRSVSFETRVGRVNAPRRTLRYEYWNGSAWSKLAAADDTNVLTRPGVIEFLVPSDIAPSERFGMTAHWLRAVLQAGDNPPVQLRALLPNTVIAANASTVKNEVLGSSDASAGQLFRTARTPVLAAPLLEVREAADGWIPWRQVTDFYASGTQDRHYVLDHLAGTVRFGDGVNGRIPPRGVGNVRMGFYRVGGGARGNRDAGTVVQLKSTVPYIAAVTNLEPAAGGVDSESSASLVARAPRALRHGGRAVAIEDYEDLAREASAAVARAKVVPLRDLSFDPLSSERVPGTTSVIVVPVSADAKPTPSVALLDDVEDYLGAHMTPTASVRVIGPIYVRVDVTADVALTSLEGASEVEDAIRTALNAFLHPLSGGRDGQGWDFGRQPFLSDLYAVVSAVAGVDHLRALHISQVEEVPGAIATGRFLVYSGQHQITLSFVGAE